MTASNDASGACQSSNELVTTEQDGKAASRCRATAASDAPSSTAVTASPRSASGTVACPVPAPISATRSPGARPASRTRLSNMAAGKTGRVRW